MQDKHVPSLGVGYWLAFAAVSLFGAIASDYATAWLGGGHRGAPLLAVALVAAVILLAERYDPTSNRLWYWLLIAVVPTASVNLGDSVAADLGVGDTWMILGLAALLVATFVIGRSEGALLLSTLLISRPAGNARPVTDTGHWIAMAVATTLGSVIADFFAHRLGVPAASAVVSVLALGLLTLYGGSLVNRLLLYWLAVVALRAAGEALGDLLVRTFGLGLPLATALSGGFAAAVVLGTWLEQPLRRGSQS